MGDEFPDLELTIGNGNYISKNGALIWDTSGTWTWVAGKTNQVLRDDNVVIDLMVKARFARRSVGFLWKSAAVGGKAKS